MGQCTPDMWTNLCVWMNICIFEGSQLEGSCAEDLLYCTLSAQGMFAKFKQTGLSEKKAWKVPGLKYISLSCKF